MTNQHFSSLMLPYPILFTIPNFITAGSGQAMLNIVERLDRKKFAPAVCVLKKGGRLDKRVEELGIPFIHCACTTLFYGWQPDAAAQWLRWNKFVSPGRRTNVGSSYRWITG